MLFNEPQVVSAFASARNVAEVQHLPLRQRLVFEADAARLHRLRWETLRDPHDDMWLGANPKIWLSRFVAAIDWATVTLRARSDIRTLAVIASPSDLATYGFDAVQVSAHRKVAEDGLRLGHTTILAGERRPTLEAIGEGLREACDIFYLVAHGRMVDGEPWLWLENDDGTSVRISGTELAKRMAELPQRPRLAVLMSCESAGSGDEHVQASLGLQIAGAGVPAVVAMQRAISMPSAWQFLKTLTTELKADGHIDRAVAVARAAIRDRPDAAAPVLYSRLKTGRIWYVPGFADPTSFSKWPTLVNAVIEGRCTPVLGLGLLESYVGSSRDLARQWADSHGFPLGPEQRDDLPQVAQFLAVNQDDNYMRAQLRQTFRTSLLKRFGDTLPPSIDKRTLSLNRLLQIVAAQRAKHDPREPHFQLAQLPIPLYLTTSPDMMLAQALRMVKREPELLTCPWNKKAEFEQEHREPSKAHPMVYHLFGHLDDDDSLVLTEDDYFRYLKGITLNRAIIPGVVRHRLTETSLLFLGFRLDEWNFRVFLRSLLNEETSVRRGFNSHVAVQLDIDESRIDQPEQARRYLQEHLNKDKLSIFWGSAEEFITELVQRVRAEVRRRQVS
jgi:hypothetical protein